MFEKILEIMMEIIFDGTINSAGIKRVPFLFRILTALMIPLFLSAFRYLYFMLVFHLKTICLS